MQEAGGSKTLDHVRGQKISKIIIIIILHYTVFTTTATTATTTTINANDNNLMMMMINITIIYKSPAILYLNI